jgi:surface-adhesin protein E
VARRPLEREGICLDGGRRTTQLKRDSLGARHGPCAYGWHMKTHVRLAVLLASIVAPSMAPCQVATSHGWVRLLTTQGEAVDLDTLTVGRTDGSFIVWLRWDFDRHRPAWRTAYRVEQVEVDCRGRRERMLSATTPAPPNPLGPGDSTRSTSQPLDSVDTKWRVYSNGSLGAQSVRELCRRLTSA